jgi:run domain Beclin-1 interacting and cysteine-rich containing protein
LDFLKYKNSNEEQKELFEKWLLENISKSKLSNILSFILSDTEHMRNCYQQSSFILTEEYQNALMVCVSALETNERNYLEKIDSSLYEKKKQSSRSIKCHQRSISQPHITVSPMPRKSILSHHMRKFSRTFDNSRCYFRSEKVKVTKKWKSMPNLNTESHLNRPRSKTICLHQRIKLSKKVSFKQEIAKEAAEEDVPYFEYRDSNATIAKSSKSDFNTKNNVPITVVNVDDIKIHTDYRFSPEYRSSSASSASPITQKKSSIFSLFESPLVAAKIETSQSTSPTTDFFLNESVVSGEKLRSKSTFVCPTLSQDNNNKRKKSRKENLAQFIQTINNVRPKVELDRENAHFHLSEAIIAACTQLKWKKTFDEKYKIPKDWRIRQGLYQNSFQNVQPPPKLFQTPPKFTIGSIEDEICSSVSSEEPPAERKSSSSDSEDMNVPHMEWNSSMDLNSPESIAMSLMSKFKNEKLPSANSLLWLVSESQAPQSLLPIPDSYPINPDENINFNAIRGQQFWAPPRGQVIFTVHPPPDRKRQLLQQANRCAGCGMKVSAAYTHKFRYCDYTSKFFCTACHKLQVSTIPARVLEKWDFGPCPVSNFAYKWLDQIWNLPLFHVSDLNPQLYQKIKQLSAAREARLQLKYVLDFINQCRFAEKDQEAIKRIHQHWIEDVDIWSMQDFVNVRNGTFTPQLQEIINNCENHIIKNGCEVRKKLKSRKI